MRKLTTAILIVTVFVSTSIYVIADSPDPEVTIFDSFEVWGDNYEQRVESTWSTWSSPACRVTTGECNIPEYKQANQLGRFAERVHNGQNAQQYFTPFTGHRGGIYKVFDVEPGTVFKVQVWGMFWSTDSDDPHAFDPAQNGFLRIGVDPHGGHNAMSASVIWGEYANPPNKWRQIPSVQATAGMGGQITVFLNSDPLYALKHNDVYWDELSVIAHGKVASSVVPAPPGVAADVNPPALPPPPDPILEGLIPSGESITTNPAVTGGTDVAIEFLGGLGLSLLMYLLSRKERVV